MASYNKVRGTYASENPHLLTEILKGEWGYDGVVVSDWGAVHSTAPAATAGTRPGDAGTAEILVRRQAARGRARMARSTPTTIDNAARRLVRLILRCGLLDGAEAAEGRTADATPPGHCPQGGG